MVPSSTSQVKHISFKIGPQVGVMFNSAKSILVNRKSIAFAVNNSSKMVTRLWVVLNSDTNIHQEDCIAVSHNTV